MIWFASKHKRRSRIHRRPRLRRFVPPQRRARRHKRHPPERHFLLPNGGAVGGCCRKRTQRRNQKRVLGFSRKAEMLIFEIMGTLLKSDHRSRTGEHPCSSVHSCEAAAAFNWTDNNWQQAQKCKNLSLFPDVFCRNFVPRNMAVEAN